jgi:hypothetical protein
MLVRLLYASRAAAPPTLAIVDEILQQSRRNNPQRGITGILCYSGDLFVQVLEGGRDEVCELFDTIVRDPRHADPSCARRRAAAKRWRRANGPASSWRRPTRWPRRRSTRRSAESTSRTTWTWFAKFRSGLDVSVNS